MSSVVLLGTAGGPGGHRRRAGIATMVEVDGLRILVDAGVGVTRQLAFADVGVGDVDVVILTHLHDDHTAGLPALMTFRHTMRKPPLTIVGPPGTELLYQGVLAYMKVNTSIRSQEGRLVDPDTLFDVREVEPGVVFSADSVAVTAVENSHFSLTSFSTPQKSYALRFELPDRTVVFTGDTGESAAVEDLALGADLLVCEMVTDDDISAVPPPVQQHMRAEHLSPTQVGQLAARAGVGTVVLSHYTDASKADLAAIRDLFSGEVIAGEDLMRL